MREKLFDRTPPKPPTIPEQEAAYKIHYEAWFRDRITLDMTNEKRTVRKQDKASGKLDPST